MSREHELMRMICEQPGDDAPRLILADWWEEQGRCDRAEFVRVGCELAAMGPKPVVLDQVTIENVGGGQYRLTGADYENPQVGQRVRLKRANLMSGGWPRHQLNLVGLIVAKLVEGTPDMIAGTEMRNASWLLKPDGWPKWNGKRWKELADRNHELLDRWGWRWKTELDHEMCSQFPARLLTWGDWGRWSRGFVNSVSCTPETFVRVAKYLFAFAPVEQVMLLRPVFRWEGGDGWFSDKYHSPSGIVIPHAIWENLRDQNFPYASEADAFADLNQACVTFGREEAGLPELASGDRVNA